MHVVVLISSLSPSRIRLACKPLTHPTTTLLATATSSTTTLDCDFLTRVEYRTGHIARPGTQKGDLPTLQGYRQGVGALRVGLFQLSVFLIAF